jgi:hypothetical protein
MRTTGRDTRRMRASRPGAFGPSGSGPVAPEPVAPEPGASDPGASDPGASEPSASDPSASDPSASEPSASEPSASEPSKGIPVFGGHRGGDGAECGRERHNHPLRRTALRNRRADATGLHRGHQHAAEWSGRSQGCIGCVHARAPFRSQGTVVCCHRCANPMRQPRSLPRFANPGNKSTALRSHDIDQVRRSECRPPLGPASPDSRVHSEHTVARGTGRGYIRCDPRSLPRVGSHINACWSRVGRAGPASAVHSFA